MVVNKWYLASDSWKEILKGTDGNEMFKIINYFPMYAPTDAIETNLNFNVGLSVI